jgi:hypothetical protein
MSRGRRRSPRQKASWSFLRLFHCWPSSARTSICVGGPAEVRGPSPPTDAECRGGSGEVRLGDDFVWWPALSGSLRKTLLSALAKEKIGDEIAQFGSCTFTPKSGKTSTEVVELVPCTRNKWGNWWDFWFYISEGVVEDHPGLPVAVMCSHHYVAYPQFEVAKDDEDEGVLRCAARMSSWHDLVEEFVGYGVWPLACGWALGKVCPREMPSYGGQLVRSPAFALDLRGRDPAAFVREAEDGAARIVGRYVPRTEGLWSWDICGSNDRLNRIFELNRLSYGDYPGVDAADRRGKKPMGGTEEGPSQEATPAAKKTKLGTIVGGMGVSDNFAVELMGTCVAPGGRMSSPELRESSARMLEVTGGSMAKECSNPLGGRRRHVYVSYSSWLQDFPLQTEYCCCCVGSDDQGPSGRCTEASGGHQDGGPEA